MALFCSPCKPPILCPNFPRNHAIRNPFTLNTSIRIPLNCEITAISFSSVAKLTYTFIQKAECRSNLSSPGEIDEGAPSSVIIFIKEGGLRTAFSRFGEVRRVKIVSDKKTRQSLGYAYVWFTREEHAQAAVEEMNGQFFEGRFIHVAVAKPGSCKTRPKPTPYKF